jgi:hypothetical protein
MLVDQSPHIIVLGITGEIVFQLFCLSYYYVGGQIAHAIETALFDKDAAFFLGVAAFIHQREAGKAFDQGRDRGLYPFII